MKCWKCDNESQAICIFCGRAVCKDHYSQKPNILGAYDENGDDPHVLMVKNAIWCGICEPIPRPIRMPEIE